MTWEKILKGVNLYNLEKTEEICCEIACMERTGWLTAFHGRIENKLSDSLRYGRFGRKLYHSMLT